MKTILLFLTLTCSVAFAGSPARAKLISRNHDRDHEQWITDIRTATTDEAMNAAWLRRPDPIDAGRAIWQEIKGNLKDTWTLEYSAWLLVNAPEFAKKRPATRGRKVVLSPAGKIREAVQANHLRSPKVGPYCIALTHVQDPHAMKLLGTIEKVNPSAAVRGAAALAQAILHRRLGDDGFGMHFRHQNLTEAIKAPDLTVGRTTTQSIVADELFRMSNLSLSTIAPDFIGTDSRGRTGKLSDLRGKNGKGGKVTLLFFWHALMPSHDDTLAIFRKYQEELAGEHLEIIGVNMDNPRTLTKHVQDGNVTWRNFSDTSQKISKLYRIERWPFVYVLDQNHKIRYAGEPGAFVKITATELVKQLKAAKAAALKQPGQ